MIQMPNEEEFAQLTPFHGLKGVIYTNPSLIKLKI